MEAASRASEETKAVGVTPEAVEAALTEAEATAAEAARAKKASNAALQTLAEVKRKAAASNDGRTAEMTGAVCGWQDCWR